MMFYINQSIHVYNRKHLFNLHYLQHLDLLWARLNNWEEKRKKCVGIYSLREIKHRKQAMAHSYGAGV